MFKLFRFNNSEKRIRWNTNSIKLKIIITFYMPRKTYNQFNNKKFLLKQLKQFLISEVQNFFKQNKKFVNEAAKIIMASKEMSNKLQINIRILDPKDKYFDLESGSYGNYKYEHGEHHINLTHEFFLDYPSGPMGGHELSEDGTIYSARNTLRHELIHLFDKDALNVMQKVRKHLKKEGLNRLTYGIEQIIYRTREEGLAQLGSERKFYQAHKSHIRLYKERFSRFVRGLHHLRPRDFLKRKEFSKYVDELFDLMYGYSVSEYLTMMIAYSKLPLTENIGFDKPVQVKGMYHAIDSGLKLNLPPKSVMDDTHIEIRKTNRYEFVKLFDKAADKLLLPEDLRPITIHRYNLLRDEAKRNEKIIVEHVLKKFKRFRKKLETHERLRPENHPILTEGLGDLFENLPLSWDDEKEEYLDN